MKRIAIIGAGASGIAAAIRLADLCPECEIILTEKNERIGKKLLATGNGRCNITNTAVSKNSFDSSFAEYSLKKYGFDETKRFLASLGLYIKPDSEGRCYPLSESANNVLNIFLSALEKRRIKPLCSFEVKSIKRENGGYKIKGTKEIFADAVILAVGSAASVKGYNGADLLKNLGFDYLRPKPALCPIPSDEDFLKQLKGVRVKADIYLNDKKESGEIQFNENNVSGICVFNLSKYVKGGDRLIIDLAPALNENELIELIEKSKSNVSENTALLDFLLKRKLSAVLIKKAGIKLSDKPENLKSEDIKKLAEIIKGFSVKLNEPKDFKNAQTVCGGLGENQINKKTLESKAHKGLFVCGELLDADGPCGGYNLQWAWSSALNAAESANNYLFGDKN